MTVTKSYLFGTQLFCFALGGGFSIFLVTAGWYWPPLAVVFVVLQIVGAWLAWGPGAVRPQP